jgi:hypothetical protein
MESLIAAIACFLKTHAGVLFGGFAGGFIRSVLAKTGTKTEKLFGGFVACLVSYYMTPIVVMLIGATIPASSISFIIGILSMSLCEALISLGRDYQKHPGKLKADIRAILLRVLAARDDTK